MKQLYNGFFATRIYLPLSQLSKNWRRFSRRMRGKTDPTRPVPQLPEVSWKECTPVRAIRIWEDDRADGNVRASELAVLSALASGCPDGSNLFEIGTFDGRTTINLALNSPANCRIYTLDLPPGVETKFSISEGEKHLVEKPSSGARYEKYRSSQPQAVGRIHQLLGDSAAFDYSPYRDSCSLIFVDGSHMYNYVMSDTRAAMAMIRSGGVIVWHDYSVWDDVTRALDELEQKEAWGLRHIKGTSLVYWKKP